MVGSTIVLVEALPNNPTISPQTTSYIQQQPQQQQSIYNAPTIQQKNYNNYGKQQKQNYTMDNYAQAAVAYANALANSAIGQQELDEQHFVVQQTTPKFELTTQFPLLQPNELNNEGSPGSIAPYVNRQNPSSSSGSGNNNFICNLN